MSQTNVTDPAREQARESFTGRRLTDGQFTEAYNVVGIFDREIQKSGSFVEKLTDYAHAFARSQKFDAVRGEMILRDLYSARFGQSMNQTREALLEREVEVKERGSGQALNYARSIEGMIKDGPTMPFYQAYDRAAVAMSRSLRITEPGPRS